VCALVCPIGDTCMRVHGGLQLKPAHCCIAGTHSAVAPPV
jgi:hypothetical protein